MKYLLMISAVVALLRSAMAMDSNSSLTTTSANKYIYSPASLPKSRIQWNENRGYCGEVSTILAAMSYGSYFSQYDLRLISAKYKDNAQTAGEYLVNMNDQYTATAIQLASLEWNNLIRDTQKFLVWIKQQTMQGHPVTIGVYMNHYLFYNNRDPTAGDEVYDHIVTVYNVQSNFPDSDIYHEDDIITISDHGLWNPYITDEPRYLYSYSFKEFQGNRRQANSANGLLYTLPNDPSVGNCGISHTNVISSDASSLLPVKLETSMNYEKPEIGYLSNERPAAMDVEVTITISNIQTGVEYKLYKFNDERTVPTAQYNALSPAIAVKTWNLNLSNNQQISVKTIKDSKSGEDITTLSVTDKIVSSDKAIYRCVLASAP